MTAEQVRARLTPPRNGDGGCVIFDHTAQRIWYNGKMVEITRVVWELACGKPPPADKQLCRTCANPHCVAPVHRSVGKTTGRTLRGRKKGTR